MKNKKKIVAGILASSILVGSVITYNQNNKVVVTQNIAQTQVAEHVGMPYINSNWEDYIKLPEEERLGEAPEKFIYDYIADENQFGDYRDLPKSFNLREKYSTTLYDQGEEGLCWAYATATMLESNLKITKNLDKKISINHLDYLTADSRYYKNNYNPYSLTRTLHQGLKYLADFGYRNCILPSGIAIVEDGKSNNIEEKNINFSDIVDVSKVNYDITSAVMFPDYQNTEEYRNMLKSFIIKYGAVCVDTVSPTTFANGIIDFSIKDIDKLLGYGHAMVIVGWDDNKGKDIDGDGIADGAWILQNSWDEAEYKEYYITYRSRIQGLYGVKTIEDKNWDINYDLASMPIVEYDGIEVNQENSQYLTINNLEYDELRYNQMTNSNAVYGDLYFTYNKNIHTKENLKKIKFNSASQNSTYKIYISKTGNKDNFVFYKKISTDLPGLYTIDVDDILLENDKFSIKIENCNGTLFPQIFAFTSVVSQEDLNSKIKTTIDKGCLNLSNNFEYHITSYVKDIQNGSTLTYKFYDENGNEIKENVVNNVIVNNGKAVNKFEYIDKYELNQKVNVVISLDGEQIDNLDIVYNPIVYADNISGKGTMQDPYVITNTTQLKFINYCPKAYFKLGNDIDLTMTQLDEITYNKGIGWKPLNKFYGTFDGNGYSIKNMVINCQESKTYVNSGEKDNKLLDRNVRLGLFSSLNGATIKNLKIDNAKCTIISIPDKAYTGLLAGEVIDSNISNVIATGEIISDGNKNYSGLLIGRINSGSDVVSEVVLDSISVIGKIQAKRYETVGVGGIVGIADNVKVKLQNALVKIDFYDCISISRGAMVGGIIGSGKLNSLKNVCVLSNFEFASIGEDGKFDMLSGSFEYENIANIENLVILNNRTNILDKYSEKSTDNIIRCNSINDFKNLNLETLKFDESIWEYLENNPFPTLKSQPYYFNEQLNEEDIISHKYQFIEDEQIIANIIPETDVSLFIKKLNLDSNKYVARVFEDEAENRMILEGNAVSTGNVVKIYGNNGNGKPIKEYTLSVLGDLSHDGQLDLTDCTLSCMSLIGDIDEFEPGTPDWYAADFDKDGKVRLNDVQIMILHVLKVLFFD